MGCYSLRQGIFPAQGLKPGLLVLQHILYHLSHQGSQVSMRVARGSASWLSSHGRGLGPRDASPFPAEQDRKWPARPGAHLTHRGRAPGLLPGKSHGRRSLVGCSPWGLEELDTTEQLPFHFSSNAGDPRHTALIPGSGKSPGEGNGNLHQYSCLESSTDRGAWWATVRGVAKSRT